MRNSYSTNLNLPSIDAGLLVLRIGVAALMLTHGVPKLLMLFGSEEIAFADPIGLGATTSLLLSTFAEFVCAILILFGLGTRLAAIPLIINMAVAFFIFHAQDPFKGKELAGVYLLIFIVIMVTGAGKYALDYYWLKRTKRS